MPQESTAPPFPTPSDELLRVENLRVHFSLYSDRLRRREAGVVRAVDGLSFTLRQGETLALIGPARSGKTTVARALALLERPTAGRILFQGQDLTTGRGRRLKRARRQIQMIFSDPYVAFAPRMTVRDILYEAIRLSELRMGGRRDQRLLELLAQAGLNRYLAVRFPRDLSGGYRQRLALARALAPGPSLLICDQPTAFLSAAIGDHFIDLLHTLCQQRGLTMLLTARQLHTARHADRVAVMILGRIVEMGYYPDLVRRPLHPFTQRLLQPHPDVFIDKVSRSLDPLHPASGCFYAPVCPLVEARCQVRYPDFVEGAPDQGVACHLVQPLRRPSPNALANNRA